MGHCACDVALPRIPEISRPVAFYLELVALCNNACVGCSNTFSHTCQAVPLSAEQWITVIEQLVPSQPYLRLTGGEPTLHPQFAQIVCHVDKVGLPFSVFTNARWLSPKRTLVTLAGAHNLECLLISLHGARAASHEAFTGVPGSFDETVANIRRANEAGLRVTTSTVITHRNFDEVADVVALGHELGTDHAVFNRFIGAPISGLETSTNELLLAVQETERQKAISGNGWVKFGTPIPHCFAPNSSTGCMAGFAHVTIDPWANVKPCSHVSWVAGNILDEPLDTIMHSPVMQEWRRGYLAHCEGCSKQNECFAGCQAMALLRGRNCDPLIDRNGGSDRLTD